MGSYSKIDYRIRPAKAIERKMLAESFRRLSEFDSLTNYEYVGFGSLYFTDFVLFHKALNIKSMTSIEDETDPTVMARFIANVPYKYIKMLFGKSNTVLPTLSWEAKTIVWLDYDYGLTSDILEDIRFVTSRAQSGSVILVSLNAGQVKPNNPEDDGLDPLTLLKKKVGGDFVPPTLKASDLSGWGVAKSYWNIVRSCILDTIPTVNQGHAPDEAIQYRQLYNFHYEDGTKMLTTGGIIVKASHSSSLEKCGFNQLQYIKSDQEAFRIDPPFLTHREMRKIESLIPTNSDDLLSIPIKASDIQRYEKFYRYFPHFAEAEIQ